MTEKTILRMKELQAGSGSVQVVQVGNKLLENVFNFSYLGSNFPAGGDRSRAMKVRMARAKERFGSMW